MGNSDSHALFVDGIQRLLVEDVPDNDREFWSALFTAPMSIEDVFEIIGPDHVRQLRQKRPRNLQVLLRRIVNMMADVCTAADEGALPPRLATAANTTVRLLTRIVPFLLEEPEDPVVRDLLWRPGGCRQGPAEGAQAGEAAVPATDPAASAVAGAAAGLAAPAAAEAPASLADAAPPARASSGAVGASAGPAASDGAGAASGAEASAVCGHDILHFIGRFLFLPGYTVTPRNPMAGTNRGPVPTHRVDARVVWKGGVGVSDQMPAMPSQTHHRARSEVLRCVLACLSGPLFQTYEEYNDHPPNWLLRFTGGEVCHTANLFCSLMSIVFTYDPVGWGVPYGGYFASGTEEDLVDVALQVLCVVIDFDPSDDQPDTPGDGVVKEKTDEGEPVETEGTDEKRRSRNVYRYMLQNVCKDAEIDLIFAGLVRLLSTVHQANQTYLPNSFRSVGFYQEALVLLWHLLTLNRTFTRRIADQLDTNQIILPVLYLLQQSQNVPQLVGLLHTASFVLLVLSSERSFAVRLNEPYHGKIPLMIPQFQGSHADVIALSLHKVISDGIPRPQNDALVEMLLTVLCNVSPYIKSFALESCLKLLSLVERCSRPGYIFRSAFTHNGLLFLLEMLNNIIQYQFEGNAMMVYSVLRDYESFRHLADLELPGRVRRPAGSANSDGAAAAQEGALAAPGEAAPTAAASMAAAASEGAAAGAEAEAEAPAGEAPPQEAAAEELDEASWTPTEAWLSSLKKKMPLQTILCLIEYLAPRIQAHCKNHDVTDQGEILRYLRQTTMVGILPVPHPIVIRTYQANGYTSTWFTRYVWGVIFTRSQRMPLYDWKKIRLVVIDQ